MDSELGELKQRVKTLEQWREQREQERNFFRRSWSDDDIQNLRIMLTAYAAAASVKAFWKSFIGKMIIFTAIMLEFSQMGLAIANFYAIHHKG